MTHMNSDVYLAFAILLTRVHARAVGRSCYVVFGTSDGDGSNVTGSP